MKRQESRIDREKKVVEMMVRLYCLKKEKNRMICPDCEVLIRYARQRLEGCKFGEGKPVCQKCAVHCYKPEMRERIRRVMRFSGPRMIFYAPLVTIRHLIDSSI